VAESTQCAQAIGGANVKSPLICQPLMDTFTAKYMPKGEFLR